VFDISDQELDGIEARASGHAGEPVAFRPMGDTVLQTDSGGSGGGGNGTAEPPPMTMAPVPQPLPSELRRDTALGAGKAMVYVTLGMVVGAVAGGAYGAATGVVAVGALRNLSRVRDLWSSSSPEDRIEAGKSTTLGLFGLGASAFLGYQAYKEKSGPDGD